jgi:hypothetical protein
MIKINNNSLWIPNFIAKYKNITILNDSLLTNYICYSHIIYVNRYKNFNYPYAKPHHDCDGECCMFDLFQLFSIDGVKSLTLDEVNAVLTFQ